MKKTAKKRGRPRKAHAMTAAERMRAYRKRKRAAGLKNVRRWEPEKGTGVPRYSDHQILDARSLALHCEIAQKLSRDPSYSKKPKQTSSVGARIQASRCRVSSGRISTKLGNVFAYPWRDLFNRTAGRFQHPDSELLAVVGGGHELPPVQPQKNAGRKNATRLLPSTNA